MFENIIGYDIITQHWENIIKDGTIPPSMLVCSLPSSGKLSFALELSRCLLCTKNAEWNCTCKQCVFMRLMENENVLLLGKRNFMLEIRGAEEMLSIYPTARTHLFFYRAIQKVLQRAHYFLWEDMPASKKIQSALAKTEEYLHACRNICVTYATALSECSITPLRKKQVKDIIRSVEKLIEEFPTHIASVHLMRNMISWVRMNNHANARIVIIEKIEHLNSSASNVLLKILEEPPKDVYFILTTENISLLLPTIRSRLCVIQFPSRSLEYEKQVLKKVFRLPSEKILSSLRVHEYLKTFHSKGAMNEDIDVAVEKYFWGSLEQKPFDRNLILFTNTKSAREQTLYFLAEFQKRLRNLLENENVISQVISHIFHECMCSVRKVDALHMSPKIVLETLYYKVSDYYKNFSHV